MLGVFKIARDFAEQWFEEVIEKGRNVAGGAIDFRHYGPYLVGCLMDFP